MKKKRKPAYLKMLKGMECCYYGEERECSECPYDKYNDSDFFARLGTAVCMEKLNKDMKDFTENLINFTTCQNCICWRKNFDENGNYHLEYNDERGKCSVWNTEMLKDEFCSRGGLKDD